MIPKNTFSYHSATAAILDIESYPNMQQCNLWTVMMCLCEIIKLNRGRYRWEKTKHYVLSGYIWNTIVCVMLKQQVFEIETNTKNF